MKLAEEPIRRNEKLLKTIGKFSSCIVVLLMLEMGAGCCSTPKSVAKMEGQGCKQVFHAPYESAWAASRGAAGRYTRVLQANKESGFILGKLGINDSTFGENVAIWVHALNSRQSSIEVVSRHAGPPVLPDQGLEKPIMDNISVMLDEGEVFR